MKTWCIRASWIGLCLWGVSSLFAQPPDDGPRGRDGRRGFMRILPIMSALDTDEDGELSTEEIDKATAALKTLDKDSNGRLTEDELRPELGFGRFGGGRGGPGGPENVDGPPRPDAPGAPDANGRGRRGPDDGPGGGRGGRGGGFGGGNVDGFLDRAFEHDADKDGKLSRDELRAMVEQMGRGFGFGGRRGADRPPRPQRPE